MFNRATKALLALALATVGLPAVAVAQAVEMPPETADAPPEPMSQDAAHVATWVSASGDNGGRPFIIIDKTAAAVLVFGVDGQLAGTTPALIGEAIGDDSVPGVGNRLLSAIKPGERTTPAGRYLGTLGKAIGHKDLLWIDYSTSLALHRVVAGTRKERRKQRLESPTSDDNRITYGCINVAASFYDNVIATLFGHAGGVVYILPETKSLAEVFPGFRVDPPPSQQAALGW